MREKRKKKENEINEKNGRKCVLVGLMMALVLLYNTLNTFDM